MEFEWDDNKADSNYRKHAIRFSEAASIWMDGNALEIPDPDHSDDEDRWIRLGTSRHLRTLVVVFVEKVEGSRIRIISARRASAEESAQYMMRLEHEK